MSDQVYDVSSCSPPDYSVAIDYSVNAANGLLQRIPDTLGNGEYQGVHFDECRIPEDGPKYVTRHWYDRAYVYDENGRMLTADEVLRNEESCTTCGSCTAATAETETRYVNEWDYSYDLWGHRVSATQVRTRWSRANNCGPNEDLSDDASNSRTDRWFFDGYGRLVMTELPVVRSSRLASGEYTSSIRLFHALDGGLRIFSRDTGEAVPTESLITYYKDTFREVYRNPETGEPIKFRNNRAEMGPSGDSSWPSGTTLGETYGTELYGVLGELLLSNGNPEGDTPSINEDVMRGPVVCATLVGGPAAPNNQELEGDDGDRSEDLAGGSDNDARPNGTVMLPDPWLGGWSDPMVGGPSEPHGETGGRIIDDPSGANMTGSGWISKDGVTRIEVIPGSGVRTWVATQSFALLGAPRVPPGVTVLMVDSVTAAFENCLKFGFGTPKFWECLCDLLDNLLAGEMSLPEIKSLCTAMQVLGSIKGIKNLLKRIKDGGKKAAKQIKKDLRKARDRVPGSIKREFPAEHLDKSLLEIEEALAKAKGPAKESLKKAKKLIEQGDRLIEKNKGRKP